MAHSEIKTRIARIYLDDQGIINKEFVPGSEESLEDAKEAWAAVTKLSNGKACPMLVDFTELRKMDSKARTYYSEQETWQTVTACAGITRSFVGRVISNFFLGLNKTPNPTKLFNSKEEALAWLSQNSKSNSSPSDKA
jgi:hypothetical protein